MTDKEYYEWQYRQMAGRQGCWGPVMMACIIVAVLLMLCGCRTKYVPVETVKTEIVHQTDTVEKKVEVNKETNTIIREGRPEDSVLLAKLGIKLAANERLLIIQQEQINSLLSDLKELHYKDSVRVDSIQVPYPVERELSRWEQVCVDYGKIMMGVTAFSVAAAVLAVIMYVRRKINP